MNVRQPGTSNIGKVFRLTWHEVSNSRHYISSLPGTIKPYLRQGAYFMLAQENPDHTGLYVPLRVAPDGTIENKSPHVKVMDQRGKTLPMVSTNDGSRSCVALELFALSQVDPRINLTPEQQQTLLGGKSIYLGRRIDVDAETYSISAVLTSTSDED